MGATVTVTVIITIRRQQQQQQQVRIDTIWRRKTSHNTSPSLPALLLCDALSVLSLFLPSLLPPPMRAHRKTKQAPDARFNQQQMRPATERGQAREGKKEKGVGKREEEREFYNNSSLSVCTAARTMTNRYTFYPLLIYEKYSKTK